ncbi:MAG: family 1 glycosylhydrolase, partial [Propionibacteriaceae bacterium]|nr:family 1 glycosylhydrolase [Propionibacteriaceae bacterium]
VALMAGLGLNSYRFSVSWPRVLDGERVNEAGMDFYSRLVDELLGAGIEPWLTLYHWDLPAALPGGWTNRDTAHRFADYAAVLYDRLGDRVPTWTTLNEPWCSSFLSYAGGEHAPGHTEPREAVRAMHHLLLGHGLATQALRAAGAGKLGITLNFGPVLPASDDPADLSVARRVDGTANRVFVHPLFTGEYPADVRADLDPWWDDDLVADGDLTAISRPIDVLGVNYYATSVVRAGEPVQPWTVRGRRRYIPNIAAPDAVPVPRDLPQTAMGWEVEADGLRRLLLWLHRDYTGPAGIPLVVTENGAAYPDDQFEPDGTVNDVDRIGYLRDHLAAVHAAITEGADVRGYLEWSLLDNFEWAWGYDKKFGIVAVDAAMNRVPKASAAWYGAVARRGGVEH